MLVVSDTSPLNYLVLIGHEGVLPAVFGNVVTTPGVMRELGHPASPERVRRWALAAPAWLKVRAPRVLASRLKLGPGETEAISLAKELRAAAVLIDERKAAVAASAMGLVVIGTLGVLTVASEKSLLNLSAAVSAL